MAKPAKKVIALSFKKEDQVEGGGLPTNFRGEVSDGWFEPFLYPKSDKYTIMACLEIIPDEDAPIDHDKYSVVIAQWSFGDVMKYAPSLDGIEPIDISTWDGKAETVFHYRGPFVVPIVEGLKMITSSNWAQLISSLYDAEVPEEMITNDIRDLASIYGQWDRIPQMKRTGLDEQEAAPGTKKKKSEVLVLTEYIPRKKAKTAAPVGAKTKPKPAPKEEIEDEDEGAEVEETKPAPKLKPVVKKPAPAASAADDDEEVLLETRVALLFRKALKASDTETLSKIERLDLVSDNLEGAEKKAAIKLVTNAEFLDGHPKLWSYEPDEGDIVMPES